MTRSFFRVHLYVCPYMSQLQPQIRYTTQRVLAPTALGRVSRRSRLVNTCSGPPPPRYIHTHTHTHTHTLHTPSIWATIFTSAHVPPDSNLPWERRENPGLNVLECSNPQRRFSTGPNAFSTFVYLPSDYDSLRKRRSQEKLEHTSQMSGPTSFKTGIPSIPDKQGSFTHFQYHVDPYESRSEYHKPKKVSRCEPGKSFKNP